MNGNRLTVQKWVFIYGVILYAYKPTLSLNFRKYSSIISHSNYQKDLINGLIFFNFKQNTFYQLLQSSIFKFQKTKIKQSLKRI